MSSSINILISCSIRFLQTFISVKPIFDVVIAIPVLIPALISLAKFKGGVFEDEDVNCQAGCIRNNSVSCLGSILEKCNITDQNSVVRKFKFIELFTCLIRTGGGGKEHNCDVITSALMNMRQVIYQLQGKYGHQTLACYEQYKQVKEQYEEEGTVEEIDVQSFSGRGSFDYTFAQAEDANGQIAHCFIHRSNQRY
ncbi:MAG: hypothetical protein EZS28_037627 [Streblomastix strix]|uniref:Uncharacterized protein n=1 Tax=Streblomastix strix TaxID=222440 RepID=A0A5J4U7J3_9EUKA|nr:MAG: hypothetical protein EZS28_037627 [Streblomastix strix]